MARSPPLLVARGWVASGGACAPRPAIVFPAPGRFSIRKVGETAWYVASMPRTISVSPPAEAPAMMRTVWQARQAFGRWRSRKPREERCSKKFNHWDSDVARDARPRRSDDTQVSSKLAGVVAWNSGTMTNAKQSLNSLSGHADEIYANAQRVCHTRACLEAMVQAPAGFMAVRRRAGPAL